MSAIIELKDICIRYDNEPIVQGFNLSVREGEKILFRGKSGTGKSSILKVLLGFVDICKGSVCIEGREIIGGQFNAMRLQFAYVNQDVTLKKGSIRDYIKELESYKYSNFKSLEKDVLNPDLMHRFDFSKELLEENTEQLSGGERQRLALILAIMSNRKIYLLDEVTAGLDQELKIQVIKYFEAVKETVIVVSHDDIWKEAKGFREVNW